MTRTPFRGWVLLAGTISLVLLLLPVSLPAQEKEPDRAKAEEAILNATEEDVGEQGAKVLGRLEDAVMDFRRYDSMLTAASAEDSLVLRIQIAKVRDRFVGYMGDLGELLTSAKDDGEHQELVTRGELLFVAVTPLIWELIEELREEIDGLRAGRSTMPPAERPELEDRLALLTTRLDLFYSIGYSHINRMASLGMDVTEARDTLARLLEGRANELSGRLELASLRIEEFNSRLKDLPGDADLAILQVATRKSLENNLSSQSAILDLMDALDLTTYRYREQLLTMTQDLASGLMDAKVANRLLRKGWNGARTWMSEKGPSFLVRILLFLIIVVAGRFLAGLISRVVEKSLNRAKLNMSHLLKRMTVTFSKNAISLLALVFGLAQLGLSLGPLLAGFGVVGFILGFAMQDSLSNLAAGMMILINRPYDVGDMVEISGVFGKVENMSMVSTSILTVDNQKLVVPNSKIWGDVIKNVTDQRVRRVDMTFGIAYTDDIPHAEQVLNDILDKSESVLNNPEPIVRLHTLNDSSVDFVVRPWVKTDDYWDVYWEVTRAVKMKFDEEGISIPFPQRDIHIYEESKLVEGEAAGGGPA